MAYHLYEDIVNVSKKKLAILFFFGKSGWGCNPVSWSEGEKSYHYCLWIIFLFDLVDLSGLEN